MMQEDYDTTIFKVRKIQKNMSKARQTDDLSPEEIRDIEEFRESDDGKTRTLEELLEELNE